MGDALGITSAFRKWCRVNTCTSEMENPGGQRTVWEGNRRSPPPPPPSMTLLAWPSGTSHRTKGKELPSLRGSPRFPLILHRFKGRDDGHRTQWGKRNKWWMKKGTGGTVTLSGSPSLSQGPGQTPTWTPKGFRSTGHTTYRVWAEPCPSLSVSAAPRGSASLSWAGIWEALRWCPSPQASGLVRPGAESRLLGACCPNRCPSRQTREWSARWSSFPRYWTQCGSSCPSFFSPECLQYWKLVHELGTTVLGQEQEGTAVHCAQCIYQYIV